MDDAATVLALICRCESADYGSPDTDLEDVTHYWQQVDIATRTRLVFAADGTLKGYAAVLPWGDDLNYEFYADRSEMSVRNPKSHIRNVICGAA